MVCEYYIKYFTTYYTMIYLMLRWNLELIQFGLFWLEIVETLLHNKYLWGSI